MAELQAALDAWVNHYNTERPHQALGMRPPIERFQLAAAVGGDRRRARAEPAVDRAASGGAGAPRSCGCPGCSGGSTSTG